MAEQLSARAGSCCLLRRHAQILSANRSIAALIVFAFENGSLGFDSIFNRRPSDEPVEFLEGVAQQFRPDGDCHHRASCRADAAAYSSP
jgi:hypothetical protein